VLSGGSGYANFPLLGKTFEIVRENPLHRKKYLKKNYCENSVFLTKRPPFTILATPLCGCCRNVILTGKTRCMCWPMQAPIMILYGGPIVSCDRTKTWDFDSLSRGVYCNLLVIWTLFSKNSRRRNYLANIMVLNRHRNTHYVMELKVHGGVIIFLSTDSHFSVIVHFGQSRKLSCIQLGWALTLSRPFLSLVSNFLISLWFGQGGIWRVQEWGLIVDWTVNCERYYCL
jgi:hypothetical protein